MHTKKNKIFKNACNVYDKVKIAENLREKCRDFNTLNRPATVLSLSLSTYIVLKWLIHYLYLDNFDRLPFLSFA